MMGGNILWLFFVLSALQPWLTQQYLEASRQRLIAQIERKRQSRVILLVHRQEIMSSWTCCPSIRNDPPAARRGISPGTSPFRRSPTLVPMS